MSGEVQKVERRKAVPFWKLWANPIVRRYARSRLRPGGFGVALLLVLLVAGFLFFSFRLGAMRGNALIIDAARWPIIPLLIMQGIVLFGLATGQVAGAMTAEADEGVLDYQRLAPMTPLAKVLGYLFGLPIREWALVLSTMPLTVFSMWQGEVPLKYGLQLYAVFFGAAILYHLTGLVAGTVMKNRRWAFLTSMGLVILLYVLIPQVSRFGLVYFKYFTIYPVVEEILPHLLSRRVESVAETLQAMSPQARFFGLNLRQYVVTLGSQAVLCLSMIVMLWRRWRNTDSHLLGRVGAVALFGWLQLVLLGNALPLIDRGDVFPTQEAFRRFGRVLRPDVEFWSPSALEALGIIGVYGFVSMAFLWWMTLIITPSRNTQIRGWRRTRKLGRSRLPVLSDASTSFPWVITMAGLGVTGWFVFSQAVLDSRWFPGMDLPAITLPAMILITVVGSLVFQAMLEVYGRKPTGVVAIFGGLIPVMLSVLMAVNSKQLTTAAVWVAGICPISWPIYGAGLFVPDSGIPRDVARALPNAFWFWQGVALLVTGWLLVKLRESRSKISRETMELNDELDS